MPVPRGLKALLPAHNKAKREHSITANLYRLPLQIATLLYLPQCGDLLFVIRLYQEHVQRRI